MPLPSKSEHVTQHFPKPYAAFTECILLHLSLASTISGGCGGTIIHIHSFAL